MRIRWSSEAVADLERIHLHISNDNRVAADKVVGTIYDGCIELRGFPFRGRIGIEPGSRELVFSPLPWIAVYRIKGDFVEISRIWHGAQSRQ